MPKGDGTGPTGTGRGTGRGGKGGGRMGGQALGLGGNCVCPACGHKVAHQRGVPCNQLRCPQCERAMAREA